MSAPPLTATESERPLLLVQPPTSRQPIHTRPMALVLVSWLATAREGGRLSWARARPSCTETTAGAPGFSYLQSHS